jgi:farnesyl diphosphate synthase
MTLATMMMPKLFFEQKIQDFNQYQFQFLNNLNFPDKLLLESTLYVIQTPGKKFRAMMVYACGQLFDLKNSILDPIALSIELIHGYSLVHDDLPAMDNDDYRRGQLSCHKAFDEATAILTGNTLNHLAFSLLLEKLPSSLAVPVTQLILNKIGPHGVLSGQSLDLKLLQNKDLNLIQLKQIHHLKTTALLEAIVLSVAICAHASGEMTDSLQSFAKHLGLAYQMLDDYGDIYATAQWGKKHSSDLSNQKMTFAQFYSQKELKKLIQNEFHQAKQVINVFANTIYLVDLIEQLELKLHQI